MKYGHIQTDPLEEDTSASGDPALGTIYHPALGPEDWPKFRGAAVNLLPAASTAQCFSGTSFIATCAAPQSLTVDDFALSAFMLAAAADKTGKITMDLVQYLNRILRIPVATPESAAPVDTLPALIRDEDGVITEATADLPFPANERFTNFAAAGYLRTDWFSRSILVLQTANGGATWTPTLVNLLDYLNYVNGPNTASTVIAAFVTAASDALRIVEFVHEYAIPVDLWSLNATTTTSVASLSATYSGADQNVTLMATIGSSATVDEGTVTFTVRTAEYAPVGTAVTSGPVAGGSATATYVLPGGTPPQTLVIAAIYSGSEAFASSSGTGSLTIEQVQGCEALTILPTELPYAELLQPYSQTFSTDGVAPVTFTASGTLPPGLALVGATLSGTPTQVGEFQFLVSAVDAESCVGSREYELDIGAVTPAGSLFLTGSGPGFTGLVQLFQYDGSLVQLAGDALVPYPGFAGGVRVALADLTNDGVPDPIVGAGPGGGPHVMVYDGATDAVIRSFFAYDPAFTGGVFVAAGDVNNDGVADIVTGAGAGPHVRVVDGVTGAELRSFFAFAPGFVGGVRVAAADLNGDGFAEIIAGAGPGGAPLVNVFDGATGAMTASFTAYGADFRGGVFVSAGDVNGDNVPDFVTGAGEGGGPHVRVVDGATGTELRSFFAFDPAFVGGVRVAAGDLNGDGRAEIIAAAGPGGGPHVVVFDGATGIVIASFFAYTPDFIGGVYPGAAVR
jgi:hypothetical protein